LVRIRPLTYEEEIRVCQAINEIREMGITVRVWRISLYTTPKIGANRIIFWLNSHGVWYNSNTNTWQIENENQMKEFAPILSKAFKLFAT